MFLCMRQNLRQHFGCGFARLCNQQLDRNSPGPCPAASSRRPYHSPFTIHTRAATFNLFSPQRLQGRRRCA